MGPGEEGGSVPAHVPCASPKLVLTPMGVCPVSTKHALLG